MNLWFPATLALLFGWMEFKLKYMTTMLVGFAVGTTVTNFKPLFFLFSIYPKNYYLGYIVKGVFLMSIIFDAFLVARAAYSSLVIVLVITVEFVIGTGWE